MQRLVLVGEEYRNLITDVEGNETDWKRWYDLEKPENEELPHEFAKLQPF